MLKVLLGSTVGIMSLATVVLTVVVISFWLGYCIWNEEQTKHDN
jgi:hypothetical protein